MRRFVISLLALLCGSTVFASTSEAWRTEALRVKDRAGYKTVTIGSQSAPRQTVDLCGKWLFKPSQELQASQIGADPALADSSWHIMDVPQFWTPVRWASYDGRTSLWHQIHEQERVDRLTFDPKATTSGWYRQWIEVPASAKGKRFVLKFDAIASISQVYWNGKPVASHVGMFGPIECEVTPYVTPGKRNLLAVFVSEGKADPEAAKQVAAVAVTVSVTNDMLNKLPHGFYFHELMGGIWQPVKLEITNKCRIADVFFRPGLTGANIETTVDGQFCELMKVRHTITDVATGQSLYRGTRDALVLKGTGLFTAKAAISGLKPKLWSPEHPNLYTLKTQLICDQTVVDESITTVGFRTFQVKGDKVYLNGKPYFMRGANEPPLGVTVNDKALANKFMKFMHDGNEMMTRFHGNPVGHTWLDAADKQGVGVSIEGHWPWLFLNNAPIPDKELLDSWREDWYGYVRAYRNHPAMLMLTINNENYPDHDKDPAREVEKCRIFSDVVKATREITPDLPIVFYSGYVRGQEDYDKIVKPNNMDDGDIDDRHYYFGWYGGSILQANVKDIEGKPAPGNRPLITQEHGLPYSDVDTGHCLKDYQVKASAWVGQNAFYTARPDMYLEFQGLMMKETAEKIRRDKARLVGWSLFCNFCWFKDAYIADTITPFPVYWDVKKAYSPVLVSLETANRHFTAGETFKSQVCIVNDDIDRDKLQNLTLEWRIYGESTAPEMISSGVVRMPDCLYYGKCKKEVEFQVPQSLPLDRSDMVLECTLLQGREVVSRNTYNLLCALPSWYATQQSVMVVENDPKTSAYLAALGAKCESLAKVDWASLDTKTPVVVASGVDESAVSGIGGFLSRGGKVLFLEPDVSVLKTIPGIPADQIKVVGANGEFVDIQSPQLLDGMDPMDMRWLDAMPGDVVRCCRTAYQFPDTPGITKHAVHINPHGYIPADAVLKQYSWPMFEVASGQGRALVSSIVLADDPVAKRMLRNALEYLAR